MSARARLYHRVGGKVFGYAHEGTSVPAYRRFLREAYGSLRGVKIIEARNIREAIAKAEGK